MEPFKRQISLLNGPLLSQEIKKATQECLKEAWLGRIFNFFNSRCQLMEVFVRIAEEKFLKQGLAQNMAEATQKMLDEHLLQEINKYLA